MIIRRILVDGVSKESVIAYVAAITAKNNGDARQAIRLLREAGDLASRSERTAVVTDDIFEAAKEELEASRVERAGRPPPPDETRNTHARASDEDWEWADPYNGTPRHVLPARSRERRRTTVPRRLPRPTRRPRHARDRHQTQRGPWWRHLLHLGARRRRRSPQRTRRAIHDLVGMVSLRRETI